MRQGVPFNRTIQTKLDLNGPTLGMQSQPVGTSCSVASGIATFIGIGTAIFPDNQTSRNTNTGTVTHQWHQVGVGALSDGTNITGSGTTTLTVSGLTSPDDNQNEYFCQLGYDPNNLSPNAINEPFDSASAKVTVSPIISFTKEPANRTVSESIETTFTVDATASDGSDQNLSYQWVLNGKNLSDGAVAISTSTEEPFSGAGGIEFDGNGDYLTISNANAGSVFNFGANNFTVEFWINLSSLPALNNAAYATDFRIGNNNNFTFGLININGTLTTYSFAAGTQVVGSASLSLNVWYHVAFVRSGNTVTTFVNGSPDGSMTNNTNQGNTGVVIGARHTGAEEYINGYLSNLRITTGTALYTTNFTPPTSALTSGEDTSLLTAQGSSIIDASSNSLSISVSGDAAATPSVTESSGVNSGSKTPVLTISRDISALYKVFCKVSHTTANPGIVTTSQADFDVVPKRSLIKYERYNAALSTLAESGERDVSAFGALSFRANADARSRAIAIWAPEDDVDVKITLGGGAGANRNGFEGGEGGISVFKVTLKKNEEYQIKLGVNDTQGGGPRGGTNGGGGSSILYHQARVIAVCGGGGGAGTDNGGGDGGGIQVSGDDGHGSSSGSGGRVFGIGSPIGASLPSEGSFPTSINTEKGTQLSSCTIGKYWRDQGFSPCESMGLQKFRYADGRVYEDSELILRGYKSGIAHRNNGGNGSGNEGGGGAGAFGGSAATAGNSGGGGGSGFGGGEITLLSSSELPIGSRLGGNDDVGFICIEVYRENDDYLPCIPPKSNDSVKLRTVNFRVIRFTDNDVTVTFTKTSGVGPDTLIFGSGGSVSTAQIGEGAVYERTSNTASIPVVGGIVKANEFRVVNGQSFEIVDQISSDFKHLQITPDLGFFTDSTYKLSAGENTRNSEFFT